MLVSQYKAKILLTKSKVIFRETGLEKFHRSISDIEW